MFNIWIQLKPTRFSFYIRWVRSAFRNICQPATKYPVTSAIRRNAPGQSHTHQAERENTKAEKKARHAMKTGSRSSLWVLPLGQVMVKPLFVLTPSAREEGFETKQKLHVLLHRAAYLWQDTLHRACLTGTPPPPMLARTSPPHGPQKSSRISSVCEMLWMIQTHPQCWGLSQTAS